MGVVMVVQGSALFDFTGTSPEVQGNCNAPRAVTLSALIYCLRCMVGHDVPLNQVCWREVPGIAWHGSVKIKLCSYTKNLLVSEISNICMEVCWKVREKITKCCVAI